MRHRSPFIIPMSAVVFSACVITSCHKETAVTGQGPVRVSVVVPAGTQGAVGQRTYSGTVESDRNSAVSFSVPGTISHIYVEEGQRVDKGQLLARVKSESLANANNIAQATLEEARDAYNRLKKLHDADALPEIKWVEAQSKLKQASNAAAIAAREVSDAAIYAPGPGVVAQKLAEPGQNVMAGVPVLMIVSVDEIKMSIPVPEEEIGGIAVGDAVTAELGVLAGASVEGKVVQKSVVADPLTRTYAVKAAIPNPGGRILPGMTGTVRVAGAATAADSAGTIVLPSQAVLLDWDNRNFVWVANNGKAERRYVTAGDITDGGIAVKSGISRGDSVIVAGMGKVSTGTPVEPVAEHLQ
ncbi:MAG: efflux RND transporter periplasmic adaptor subunit [Muribaculaceae bacterium]|nr:efflux RND transporter periplasmic adaptor subunit [Muribaculaceae bacterium]